MFLQTTLFSWLRPPSWSYLSAARYVNSHATCHCRNLAGLGLCYVQTRLCCTQSLWLSNLSNLGFSNSF